MSFYTGWGRDIVGHPGTRETKIVSDFLLKLNYKTRRLDMRVSCWIRYFIFQSD